MPYGHIIDCSADEHALIARAHMLNLNHIDMNLKIPLECIFKPLNRDEAELYRDRGVSKHCIEFLMKGEFVDPRIYAIREWNWIRTTGNKFYAWEWDEKTKEKLFSTDAFWKLQSNCKDNYWIELYWVKTNKIIQGPLSQVRNESFQEA